MCIIKLRFFFYRRNATLVELCTKCSVDNVDSYILFCRAFFGFQYSFVDAGSANAAKNKQVISRMFRIHTNYFGYYFYYLFLHFLNIRISSYQSLLQNHVHYPLKNQKKNQTEVLEFFLDSVLPTYVCDLESGNFENVQNSTVSNETESDGMSTISPIMNSPTNSNLLNKKLGGGERIWAFCRLIVIVLSFPTYGFFIFLTTMRVLCFRIYDSWGSYEP